MCCSAEMLADVAAMVGRKPPRLRVPAPRDHAACAYAPRRMAGFTGREPFVTMDGLRMAKYRMFFQSGKAERELGYRARPYREGLADAIEWFGKAGYLK